MIRPTPSVEVEAEGLRRVDHRREVSFPVSARAFVGLLFARRRAAASSTSRRRPSSRAELLALASTSSGTSSSSAMRVVPARSPSARACGRAAVRNTRVSRRSLGSGAPLDDAVALGAVDEPGEVARGHQHVAARAARASARRRARAGRADRSARARDRDRARDGARRCSRFCAARAGRRSRRERRIGAGRSARELALDDAASTGGGARPRQHAGRFDLDLGARARPGRRRRQRHRREVLTEARAPRLADARGRSRDRRRDRSRRPSCARCSPRSPPAARTTARTLSSAVPNCIGEVVGLELALRRARDRLPADHAGDEEDALTLARGDHAVGVAARARPLRRVARPENLLLSQ